MTWTDIERRAVDTTFGLFGRTVTVLSGGETVEVRAIVTAPSRDDGGFGESGFRGRVWRAEMRLADVPAPAKGDTVTIDGTAYTVAAAPEMDAAGLVAHLALRPA